MNMIRLLNAVLTLMLPIIICTRPSRTFQHCNVPRFYPTYRQLGSWVHRQRLKMKFPNKYGGLKKEQIQKLEAIGFTWRVRKDNTDIISKS